MAFCESIGLTAYTDRYGSSTCQGMVNLWDQVVDHTLKRIEAERSCDRGAQIRVGVEVVKYPPPIGSFQVLNAADPQSARCHQSPAGVHGSGRHIRIGIELHPAGWHVSAGQRLKQPCETTRMA